MDTNADNDTTEADVEDLTFTFEDVDEEAFVASVFHESSTMTSTTATTAASVDCARIPSIESTQYDDLEKQDISKKGRDSYILGTLIVRVVAARDLDGVDRGGLGNLLFGGNDRTRSAKGYGTANPYATVRYGNTTQRTSELFGTTDPIWPRGEIMYMDVTHASWESDYDDYLTIKDSNASKENVAIIGNRTEYSPTFDNESELSLETYQSPAMPILTIAIFHANQSGSLNKYPNKKGHGTGDSDDTFLGMTSIDMTQLFTGKSRSFDEWLPLQGAMSSKASVRVVCEYEASDAPPLPGDLVKFTDFCHPADLYPAVQVGRVYTVHEVDGDKVLISWTSPEGWVSSFLVHRFMLICIERHQSVVGICQDELASLRERIAYSPLVHVVQETVERVPDEGLLGIGAETIQNGVSLLSRWWDNGFETTAQDLTFATNWDGRHNPSAETIAADSGEVSDESATPTPIAQNISPPLSTGTNNLDLDETRLGLEPPLPNMPPCPITGEPMRDPVVAADGHTYERSAIARWLSTSNKSPLTGAILAHKDLVPNYMLLSSLQDAAAAAAATSSSVAHGIVPSVMNAHQDEASMTIIDDNDAEFTDDININD